MSSLTRSIVGVGTDGNVIDIECHLSNNLPTVVIVGSAGRAVSEAKDRLRGAFASSGLELPRRRITINLAPADIPKNDSGLDLGIAISILAASQQVMPLSANEAAIGELSLDGQLRPVRGIIGKLLAGRRIGITVFYVPLANLEQAQLVPGIRLYPVGLLRQLYKHLAGTQPINAVDTGDGLYDVPTAVATDDYPLSEVIGQEAAKRGLVIAAAGGHNIFLNGPPGAGKSMLARSAGSLLPALSHEEMLEVTHLASLATNNYEQVALRRPFRSPHHSTSSIALLGGGSGPRPGEISLSHRGILFLDEFPEFGRTTLEALRQPLEERVISVARLKSSVQFPADFILIATANPCPCGYHGSTKECRCSQSQLLHYRARLSGPIIDRFDLWSDVHEVDHQKLLGKPSTNRGEAWADQVQAARQRQAKRYQSPTALNSNVDNQSLRQHARLSATALTTLNAAAATLGVSARGYLRVVRVGRTIADLEGSTDVTSAHIKEAVAYRKPPPVTTV